MNRAATLERGMTLVEMAVAIVILVLILGTVGSAMGAGFEVYQDSVFRADTGATARRVLNRILAEIEETQGDSPDFQVAADSVTYNRVEDLAAEGPTYGPLRRIRFDADAGEILLEIPGEQVEEALTTIAESLRFELEETRLGVTLSLSMVDDHGEQVTYQVSGAVNVHR